MASPVSLPPQAPPRVDAPPPPPPPQPAPQQAQPPAQAKDAFVQRPTRPGMPVISNVPATSQNANAPQGLDANQQAAYAKLNAQDQSAYNDIEKSISTNGAPLELQDIRRALGGGRLDSETIQALHPLASGGKTASGYDRAQMLDSLAQDLGRPNEMLQGGTQKDCGGLAASYALNQRSPAAYVKAVTDLAEKGATTVGGMELKAGNWDPSKGTVPTQQLFADAFVNAANGGSGAGMTAQQMEQIGNVTGQKMGSVALAEPDRGQGTQADADATRAAAEKALRDSAASGSMAFANIREPNGGYHWVAVTGVDGAGPDAQVTYTALDGGQNHCHVRDFLANADSVVFSQGASNPDPGARGNPRWLDPGAGGQSVPIGSGERV